MSLDTFRNQILSNSGEGRVEVNQRDLIDKILARYSSKFVIYRELMQNSDDAESSSAKIIFETDDNNKVIRILFKNNGFTFRPEDWDRLVKIAEGNPDEQKIGAFGVGFYSLFSISENPFVTSGGQGMAFYWRGNQLFTKKGPADDDEKDWTTFLMDTREPLELLNFEDFTRFLANSLAFTENLREITVYLNDILVTKLSKKMQEPTSIKIAPEFNTFSPKNMFHLTSADFKGVQLDVKRLLIPKEVNVKQLQAFLCDTEEASVLFRIANGNLDVNVDEEFSTKMERIIKKKLPNNTSIQMIFTEFDELNSSEDYHENLSSIFKDLLSYPKQGRIYIGFPTDQTTGCCSHLAARVIPTMERELIDFAEQTLAEYNKEMLSLSGTLSRILYEYEMTQMTHFYNEIIVTDAEDNEEIQWAENQNRVSKPRTQKSLYGWFKNRFTSKKRTQIVQSDDEKISPCREWMEKWAAYAIAHFTYNPSTPKVIVSTIAETQFSNCLKQNLYILSTNGVHPISDVRLPNVEMAGFIKTVPQVPNLMLKQCDAFFKKAKDNKLIEELTFDDVLTELKNRTLSEDEIVKLLTWWISYLSKGNIFDNQLLKHARIGDGCQALDTVRFFLNPDKIPLDIDIPYDVLPYSISRHFTEQELKNWLRLNELPLVDWATFIAKKPELESDYEFAERVHHVLAKGLDNISDANKTTIQQLFSKKRCIPTEFGMMVPDESYFQSVDLFPNLATLTFKNFTPSVQRLMEHLGVRKVVELKRILDRLVNQENCDYIQVIKYLASVSSDLNEDEKKILRNKPIWPKEDLSYSRSSSSEIQRFIAKDLYVPFRAHREFGLPIIDWKGGWSNNSSEGKFLIDLGVQKYPKLETILNMAAPPTDREIREMALRYFIDNFEKMYSDFYEPDKVDVAFLPCSSSNIYAKPRMCFANDKCTIMEFQTLREDLRPKSGKLGVRQHPNHEELVKRLTENPPRNEIEAKEVFEYLKSQQKDFTDSDWNILGNFEFIPVRHEGKIELMKPNNCFFKLKEESLNDYFPCIDFGINANKFLVKCGVKDELSSVDHAQLLVDSSHELWILYKKERDIKKYLKILEKIDEGFDKITSDILDKFKEENTVISLRIDPNNKENNNYYLTSPKEIYINDDNLYQQIFNPLVAPKKLESLYRKLGCKSLHESVTKSVVPNGSVQKTKYSQQLQRMIRERASLFYLNYPKDAIRNDEKWLKKLKVREIEYMETSYMLESIKMNEKNDITTNLHQEDTSWILYVTPNSNLIDISQHIVNNVFSTYNSKDISYFNMILTAPLSSLKSMGIVENKLPTLSFLKNDQPQSALNSLQYDDIDDININSFENKESIVTTSESTQNLRNFLQDSIKSRYSNSGSNSNSINSSSIRSATKSCINESKINYCDVMPGIINAHYFYCLFIYFICIFINFDLSILGYSLQRVGTLQKIELYVPNDVGQSEILSKSRTAPLNQFINILKDLADVFEVTSKSINVFYDDNTNSTAFNRDGELFFNLKCYLGLHEQECKTKPSIDALTYWFMTFCHVLAHNFIQLHNSEFEYYSSSFAKIYMPNFMELTKKRETTLKTSNVKSSWKNFNRILN